MCIPGRLEGLESAKSSTGEPQLMRSEVTWWLARAINIGVDTTGEDSRKFLTVSVRLPLVGVVDHELAFVYEHEGFPDRGFAVIGDCTTA